MAAIKLGWKETLLLALIAITGAMALRDRLPASQAEISQIGRLASSNVTAMREYEQAIASDSSISIRDARMLRERVTRASRAPVVSFEGAKSDGDAWWLTHVHPYVPYAVGVIGAVAAYLLARVRGNRLRAAKV
jgi:hypothetical protein